MTMAKLTTIKNAISPTKRTGAKKNLLKRDGITSDRIDDILDDDLSSCDERKSKSLKKFNLKLLKRGSARNGEEDDGYESDNTEGSTRSTSSSFLRFQNRALWRAALVKKTVLQRFGDGSEVPVKNETRPWPLFDRIYKSQNQVKKGGNGEDEGSKEYDDDSVSSTGSNGDAGVPLGPAAPVACIGFDEEECIDGVELEGLVDPIDEVAVERGTPKQGVFNKIHSSSKRIQSFVGEATAKIKSPSVRLEKSKKVGGSPKHPKVYTDKKQSSPADAGLTVKHLSSESPNDIRCIQDPASGQDSREHEPESTEITTQESGIPTSEGPKRVTAISSGLSSSVASPTKNDGVYSPQQLTPPSALNIAPKGSGGKTKSPTNKEGVEAVPISIPRTISYSLRSAIGDGSVRQRNSHSLMERRPLRPNGCHIDVSYWSHRGKRNYMEDRFVVEHIGSVNKHQKKPDPISFLAVFDGHGGAAASQFCSDWLSSYIRKKNEHYPHNLPKAISTAFTRLDSDFVKSGQFDGTTACACAVVGEKVICCNAGDSRAIIVKRDGSFVALSDDHKPDRDDETKRINDLGGRVIHWGRWRVEGVLAVSRSIGDSRLKPYVTAEPDVVEHELGDDDLFLVVASDGVWDTMSNDLVAKFVLVNTCKIVDKGLNVDEKLLRWIARQVSKRARENGSSDNISCIVAKLNDK